MSAATAQLSLAMQSIATAKRSKVRQSAALLPVSEALEAGGKGKENNNELPKVSRSNGIEALQSEGRQDSLLLVLSELRILDVCMRIG